MKTLPVFAILALLSGPHALAELPLNCERILQLQHLPGFLAAGPYHSSQRYQLSLQVAQLRIALILAAGDRVYRMTPEQLDQRANGAVFRSYRLGEREFQAVDVAPGQNALIYLFEPDTTRFSGISIEAGSLLVRGALCPVDRIF